MLSILLPLRTPFFLFFFLFLIPLCFCGMTYTPTKSFSLKASMSNMKATVKIWNVMCDFKFSTIDCEQQNKQVSNIIEPPKGTVDMSYYLKKLQGECFIKLSGYWEYKICIGDKIRQSHQNDEYSLGKYNPELDKKDVQVYDDGQRCPSGPRSSKLRFMCGNTKDVVAINEPHECAYEFTLTHPSLCGAGSPFEQFAGQVSTELRNNADHWFMSLEKTASGSYICRAKNILRELKEKQNVCFTKFALQVYSVSDEDSVSDGQPQNAAATVASTNSRKLEVIKAQARHSGREIFHEGEMDLVKSGQNSYAVISGDQFSGSLEYLRVVFNA